MQEQQQEKGKFWETDVVRLKTQPNVYSLVPPPTPTPAMLVVEQKRISWVSFPTPSSSPSIHTLLTVDYTLDLVSAAVLSLPNHSAHSMVLVTAHVPAPDVAHTPSDPSTSSSSSTSTTSTSTSSTTTTAASSSATSSSAGPTQSSPSSAAGAAADTESMPCLSIYSLTGDGDPHSAVPTNAQLLCRVGLDYVPFGMVAGKALSLVASAVPSPSSHPAFAVCGSDGSIHCYRIEKEDQPGVWQVDELGGRDNPFALVCPPGVLETRSAILCVDVVEVEGEVLVGLGYQDGKVVVTTGSHLAAFATHPEFEKGATTPVRLRQGVDVGWVDGPAGALAFSPPRLSWEDAEVLIQAHPESAEALRGAAKGDLDDVCLVVGSAAGGLTCFLFPLDSLQVRTSIPVPSLHEFNSITSVTWADLYYTGRPGVLVGTYEKEVWFFSRSSHPQLDPTQGEGEGVDELGEGAGEVELGEEDKFELVLRRRFTRPILSLRFDDVNGDRVRELVVLTRAATHVLTRPNLFSPTTTVTTA